MHLRGLELFVAGALYLIQDSPNPMFDHLLESSHRDDSNNWFKIGFGEEISQVELFEVNFTHLSGALNRSVSGRLRYFKF